jgi:hypothetical protein
MRRARTFGPVLAQALSVCIDSRPTKEATQAVFQRTVLRLRYFALLAKLHSKLSNIVQRTEAVRRRQCVQARR